MAVRAEIQCMSLANAHSSQHGRTVRIGFHSAISLRRAFRQIGLHTDAMCRPRDAGKLHQLPVQGPLRALDNDAPTGVSHLGGCDYLTATDACLEAALAPMALTALTSK